MTPLPDDTLVDELEISIRAAAALVTAGVKTVGQLRDMSHGDLLRLPNFGRKSLNEIIETVGEWPRKVSSGLALISTADLIAELGRRFPQTNGAFVAQQQASAAQASGAAQ